MSIQKRIDVAKMRREYTAAIRDEPPPSREDAVCSLNARFASSLVQRVHMARTTVPSVGQRFEREGNAIGPQFLDTRTSTGLPPEKPLARQPLTAAGAQSGAPFSAFGQSSFISTVDA